MQGLKMPVLSFCKNLTRYVEWIGKTGAVPGVANRQLGDTVHSKSVVATNSCEILNSICNN